MKLEKYSGERREHPRYFPDKDNLPEVRFIFEDGEKISVEIVNISRGGLFGSTSSIEQFLEIDNHKIKTIEIIPRDKNPFRCAGKLLRLHPMREDDKCFCAVEFCKVDKEEHAAEKSEVFQNKSAKEPDFQIENEMIKRVRDAENYLHISNKNQAAKVRMAVYDSFCDITKNLSLEDRWWFYELLDEIKNREPKLPDELKQDFLELCENGLNKACFAGANEIKLGIVKS
jgi:hypothetical protein